MEFPCLRKDGMEIECMIRATRTGKQLKERRVVITYENLLTGSGPHANWNCLDINCANYRRIFNQSAKRKEPASPVTSR